MVVWVQLCAMILPVYPAKPAPWGWSVGRPTWRLRVYFLPHWFNLSDPAVEEALYDSHALRVFVGFDFGREPVPDEATV